MKSTLQILHLEDDPNDAELAEMTLDEAGLAASITRVDNRADFARYLDEHQVNLILSDFSLPAFNGSQALEIAREKCPEVPFIFLSGAIGEERAIDTLRNGATDYVLKHRMGRLSHAITRALEEANERRRRREAEQTLEHQNAELKRSNEELEQFAYIASHDLQEPLRMIGSFTQLLESQYQGKLDEDADTYINFITEGAVRMKALINDLLRYSRIGRRESVFTKLDSADLVEQAIGNLSEQINSCKPEITCGELPKIVGNAGLLIQVFQNLISNSLKFCDEEQPAIRIEGGEEAQCWSFSIHDNGIGIETKFSKRIFEVFQRLHTRADYPGNGIGLSLCKRIVHRHGGDIWLENTPESGSTFSFTIAKPVE